MTIKIKKYCRHSNYFSQETENKRKKKILETR